MKRAGSGSPVVLIHGIQASALVWSPVIDLLVSGGHEVLVPTLAGHRGGPVFGGVEVSVAALADDIESQLDSAGIGMAHLVGNSLGGWVALELGRRGRARSVVALSPAGGWVTQGDLDRVIRLLTRGRTSLIRHRERIVQAVRRPRIRRLALLLASERGDTLTARHVDELIRDIEGCAVFDGFMAWIRTQRPPEPGSLAAACPVRIAWAGRDRTIPFARYGPPLLATAPGAEHITLPRVGHVPMFDDPQLVANTILEVTSRADNHQGEHRVMPEPSTAADLTVNGIHRPIVVRRWDAPDATHVVVIAHGYGEHSGRYEHVARALVDSGAAVYAPDHHAHGRTAGDGEMALFDEFHDLVTDFDSVVEQARRDHPGLPLAVIGHSMGGIVATRYVQTLGSGKVDALVLSGPAIGGNPGFEVLLGMDPIPEVPIDPASLSRDPAVGEDYAADPLVYHGPFKRPTLTAMLAAIDQVKAGPGFGSLPVLWIHGELDQLAPLDVTRPVVESLAGEQVESHIYPGAMHEIFNETNRDEVLGHVVAFLSRVRAPAAAA